MTEVSQLTGRDWAQLLRDWSRHPEGATPDWLALAQYLDQPRQVLTAIRRVMEDMSKTGVGKDRTNQQQNFKYRGIDDVMDALSRSLVKHALIITPHTRSRTVTERETRSGGHVFHVVLEMEYDFTCETDGSHKLVGPIFGEAMDSGDKATNKAMAVAYKYAATQAFCIPFAGDDDPDKHTHEVVTAAPPATHSTSATPLPPLPAKDADGKPTRLRPGGNFGYGRKFADVPWQVMHRRDLEWFRGAERTPPNIRERIDTELAWRDWETAQLDAGRARQRAELDKPLDDDIPV